MRSRIHRQVGPLRKAQSEQALGVLIGTAPSAYLRPQASDTRRTLGYLFDSHTKNPLLPFELRCCVDRLSRQPIADIRPSASTRTAYAPESYRRTHKSGIR